MRNIRKTKRSKELIKEVVLKMLFGRETLYVMKHGGSVHFQSKMVEGKMVRIVKVDGDTVEGVVVDYIYPDCDKPTDDAVIVLARSTIGNDSCKSDVPVKINVSDIKSTEIIT